jgi:hypothetical protein
MPYWLDDMTVWGSTGVHIHSMAAAGASISAMHGRDNHMENLQSCILGHWIHSHEEDAQGVTVYRPRGYSFPPSRGREGFDFRKGGKVVYFGIARADGSEEFSGSWVIEDANRVRINLNNDRIPSFVLDVVTCDGRALKVRRHRK